jgi:hypothetical protein
VVSSAFTWPAMEEAPWTVPAAFYSALVLSLTSVAAGSNLSVILYRLGESRNSMMELQALLREKLSTGEYRPRLRQQYTLHIPFLLLEGALAAFFTGLMILVYDRAATAGSWQSDVKVRIYPLTSAICVSLTIRTRSRW